MCHYSRKSFLGITMLCTALYAAALTGYTDKKRADLDNNPLVKESTLPFGAPDFNKIKTEHFLPAMKAGIEEQRKAIKAIVDNKDSATFENTILACERGGVLLNQVTDIFFGLTSVDRTPELERVENEAVPLPTDFDDEISFNQPFFGRIKYVYDHEYDKLQSEDRKLLKEVYKNFVRPGALLPADKRKRVGEVNNKITKLQQDFGSMLPKAANEAAIWVDKVEDLAGLSEADIAQCKKDAESRDDEAPYCIVITNITQQPILASLENRTLHERVSNASIHRADGTRDFSTFLITIEIARLRAEKAELMGFESYTTYSLDNTVAKSMGNSSASLKQLIGAYTPKADKETRTIEAYTRKTVGADFKLQPYDRLYYSAKMKKGRLNFSEDEMKPYFNLDSVLVNDMFFAANKAYGFSFKERTDLPIYHKNMKVFGVMDKNDKQLALLYVDYFRRPTKRGGAWMSSFTKQGKLYNQLPIIYSVCNFAKAPEGQSTLLTWDEAATMFHEFGHALHGTLSNREYDTLSGTTMIRDFIEIPSQFNESFTVIPEVFANFAKHYKAQRAMLEELKQKVLSLLQFYSAYVLGENLAATCLDSAQHNIPSPQIPATDKAGEFKAKTPQGIGLYDVQIPPRYSTSYSNHVWGGDYAAGYYGYLWSEILAANVADYFDTHDVLKPEIGQAFRDKVLSRGDTGDLMQVFCDFTGLKTPGAKALLEARGL